LLEYGVHLKSKSEVPIPGSLDQQGLESSTRLTKGSLLPRSSMYLYPLGS
jgi:hypothetical protein